METVKIVRFEIIKKIGIKWTLYEKILTKLLLQLLWKKFIKIKYLNEVQLQRYKLKFV